MKTKKFMLYVLLDGIMLLSYTSSSIEVEETFTSIYAWDKYKDAHGIGSCRAEQEDLTCDEMEMKIASDNMNM